MDKLEKLVDGGFALLEGPVYDAATDSLLFSDAMAGGVWRLAPDGSVSTVVPHRRGIGGLARHEQGGLVVSGRNIAWKREDQTRVLLELDPALGLPGFNDLGTDSAGRIYAGSIDFDADRREARRLGFLHLIDLDGSSRIVAQGIQATNGLAESPDRQWLYHGDTGAKVVWVYRHAEDGSLSDQRPFIRWPDGGPDGLAVAEDGTLWVAMPYNDCVAVVGPDGVERTRIPVSYPTSVCFGGSDRQTLYIVTGGAHERGERTGSVYRTRVDVPGLPVAPARVPIPAG